MNFRLPLFRSFSAVTSILLLTVACCVLNGCGDKEPAQRAAFIGLLQKNILTRTGMRYVPLTDPQKKELGPAYTEQYEFLSVLHQDKEFEATFSKSLGDVQKGLQPGKNDDPLPLINTVRKAIGDGEVLLAGKLNGVREKRSAFSQPDDLKAVYDKAFTQVLVAPLEAMVEAYSLIAGALDASAALHEYLQANPGAADFSGMMLRIHKPEHEKKLQELLRDMNQKTQKAQAGFSRMNQVIR